MRIYAADDEILSLELLEEAIIEAIPGAEPRCFEDPEELLSAAEREAPDLVFLDINMPGADGIEVAKRLNEISPSVRIIFVTGYSEYAGQAFDVFAFGYVMKPCRAAAIKPLVDKMLTPLKKKNDIEIKTFGNFEISYKGKPVTFRSKLSKELLAYLVDREGSRVSRQEAAGILFGDNYSHSVQVSLTKIAQKLAEDLEAAGADSFFITDGGYYVDIRKADCDLYTYLRGGEGAVYCDEYMEQYSWAEERKYSLGNMK